VTELPQLLTSGGVIAQANGGSSAGRRTVEGFRFQLGLAYDTTKVTLAGKLYERYITGTSLGDPVAESWWGRKMIYRLTMKGVFISTISRFSNTPQPGEVLVCYLHFSEYELKVGKL
jgi:hypothetical protein